MEEGSCDLSDVSYLVLDEADRLLEDEEASHGWTTETNKKRANTSTA